MNEETKKLMTLPTKPKESAACPNCKHDSLLGVIPGYDISSFCWRCGWPVHNNGPNAPKGKCL